VVQTFPLRIPASCLSIPGLGSFNLHPGSLPGYRGPDPVFWQLKNGEASCGIALHKMDAEFDTGPLVHYEEIPIDPLQTYGLLQTNLAYAARKAVEVLLEQLQSVSTPALIPQDAGQAAYYKKAAAEDLIIDWAVHSSTQVDALVRACNPNQNGAISFFRGVLTRILEVAPVELTTSPRLAPGTVIAADATRGLQLLCSDGKALLLTVLHVEEGYFSGARFCEVFEVRMGEKFTLPAFLS
jgi:methionyl-tRNA formyltransferase